MMTGGEAVVRALAAAGVELVFGIPGTHTLPIHRHLAAAGIRHVTPRHEQGGGYAADGYARVSGRPGVVLATSGPGVVNAATPAATAWADSVPMLVVAPAMASDVEGRDTGNLHESRDQHGALASLVARSWRARTPSAAAEAVTAAFEGFASERPRPAYVDVPLEALSAEEDVAVRVPAPHARPGPDVGEAAALLAGAERPVLVLGGGARGAGDVATALGIPVLTTVNGKGIVDERHPLSLGASLRLPAAKEWLRERDVVVAVGTELGESDLWGPPLELDGRLIRIDIDPGQLDKNAPADVRVLGDARAALAGLPARSATDLRQVREEITAEALADGAPYADLCAALDEALGEDGILAGDSTMAAYYGAVHLLPMDARRRFIYPTGYATLGYSVPAAIGAKLAAPDRPVIALVGDGGLLFTVGELATAAELGIPLPVVVANNGGYGEIRDQMDEAGIGRVGVDLQVPDLVKLGEAFGGAGVRDPADLAGALREALGRPGPSIIEIAC